jgi:hypothetical protein
VNSDPWTPATLSSLTALLWISSPPYCDSSSSKL